MTTVLVTGATGTVGSRVAGELRARGARARAFVRDARRGAEIAGDGVELAVGDFADASSLRRALDGVDAVFLACANHPRQVEYETAAIDAAAAAGVRLLVKLSTIGAEDGSPLEFWDAHGRVEQHLRRSGVPHVVLRASFFMSNLLAAAESIRRQGTLFAPAAGARVGMVDPRDVAAVAAVALTSAGHEGRTYVLTGPESLTYERVAEELSAALGWRVEFLNVPDEAARQGLLGAGMPQWLADNLVRLFGALRAGAADRTTDVVRVLTGREPRSLGEFARDHAAFFAGPVSADAGQGGSGRALSPR